MIDPAKISRMKTSLHQIESDLTLAQTVLADAAQVDWVSVSADLFREELSDLAAALAGIRADRTVSDEVVRAALL